jgi:glycosyltransferase involved in cell wall biosynthesis
MPVFNGESFLVEAIESVLAQDEQDLELILADNASTDATRSICQQYATWDDRVRYVGSDRNRGIAWNFNRLVDLARAPYFKWADSDDVLEPSHVRRCADALDAEPGAVLSFTWARYIDAEGRTLRTDVHPPDYWQDARPSVRAAGFLRLPTSHVLELQGVIRRDDLAATSRMGPYAASDLALILELALRGRFAEVPEPLFLHRMHQGRASIAAPTPRERCRVHTEDGSAVLLPRWHLVGCLARGVLTSPAPARERVRTLPAVAGWSARHAGQLGYDLAAVLPGPLSRAAEAARRLRRSTGRRRAAAV